MAQTIESPGIAGAFLFATDVSCRPEAAVPEMSALAMLLGLRSAISPRRFGAGLLPKPLGRRMPPSVSGETISSCNSRAARGAAVSG
jgi:hypothetical protein